MKFYLASGFENQEKVSWASNKLADAGHIHTYDWTKNIRATTEEELRIIGMDERNAVFNSDIVIVLLPGGKGTHTELGIAIGLEKKIFLFSTKKLDPATATTFYYIEGVEHYVGNLEDFVDYIIELYE